MTISSWTINEHSFVFLDGYSEHNPSLYVNSNFDPFFSFSCRRRKVSFSCLYL